MSKTKEALEMVIEALEKKNKGSKFLGIINLESVDPLSETERKRLIEATMECLLEEGELGKLGMLLNRYEETIRNAEQQKPLSDDEIILYKDAIEEARDVCKYLDASMVDTAKEHTKFFWIALDKIVDFDEVNK